MYCFRQWSNYCTWYDLTRNVFWCQGGESKEGNWVGGSEREREIDWNKKYPHMPDMRVSIISWSVEFVKYISVRMEIFCSLSFHIKKGNWFSIHASGLYFIINSASILAQGCEMWWQYMTFRDSEWNLVGGICTPHLFFSQAQSLVLRIALHQLC